MDSQDVKNFLTVTLFVILFGFVINNVWQYKEGSITVLLVTGALISYNIMYNVPDFIPFIRRGPQINTLSGVSGTQLGAPVQEHNGEETRYVAWERGMVPKHLRKQVEGSLYFLRELMSGTCIVPIHDKRSKFEEVPQEDSENPNGCILYRGRIDGGNIRNPRFLEGQQQIERQAKIISYVQSSAAQLEEQVAALANQNIYDNEAQAQHLKSIADQVKNVQVITGNKSGAVETIGDEMQG